MKLFGPVHRLGTLHKKALRGRLLCSLTTTQSSGPQQNFTEAASAVIVFLQEFLHYIDQPCLPSAGRHRSKNGIARTLHQQQPAKKQKRNGDMLLERSTRAFWKNVDTTKSYRFLIGPKMRKRVFQSCWARIKEASARSTLFDPRILISSYHVDPVVDKSDSA